jgi:hypothetical protein
MKRRGFLGSVVGAAVAGPSMAKQAIASGMEGLNLGGVGMLEKGISIGGMGYASATNAVDGNYDPLDWPKRELAEFLGKSAADLARERLETHVAQLDPDIACMQSIALQAKIRMQRDRTFERNRAQQRGWLERQLQDAIKRLAA